MMKEVSFSIPVSGTVRIEGDSITIVVNRTETTIQLEPEEQRGKRTFFEPGRTLFDLVLEAAGNVVREKGTNDFSAAELYHEALREHPELRRNSWTSHVIACAPNHTSNHHYTARRRYFRYLGKGRYSLDENLLPSDGSR